MINKHAAIVIFKSTVFHNMFFGHTKRVQPDVLWVVQYFVIYNNVRIFLPK